jgi:NADPH2 dehydrogenase
MTLEDIARVQGDFVAAAVRARDAGFEWLELHFAHGYLGHSFLSVHANRRTDRYGGSAENRGRFLLETLRAVRAVWPHHLPLTARLGVIEFDGRDEDTVREAIALAADMRREGLDLLNVSMGFSTPDADIPWGPGLLAPVAAKVGRESGLPVAVAWGIRDPDLADQLVTSGGIDLVMIGRGHLADPHFSYRAAVQLGVEKAEWVLPAPYAHWLSRYAEGRSKA